MTIYNVNLESGRCVDHRLVEWEQDIDAFCAALKEATVGLDDPRLVIDSEMGHDFRDYYVYVAGRRDLTDAERRQPVPS